MFFNSRGRSTPKISWRVIDTTQGHNERFYPRKTLASAESQEIAQRIVDMLNEPTGKGAVEEATAGIEQALIRALKRDIGTAIDDANAYKAVSDELRRQGLEIKAEANRLRAQLFDTREQRDEARAELAGAREGWGTDYTKLSMAAVSRCLGVPMHEHVERLEAFKAARQNDAIGWTAEEVAKLIQDRDEAKAALKASYRELVEARHYWANQGPHDHVVISLAGYNKLVTERDEALAKYQACVDTVSFVDGQWVKTS